MVDGRTQASARGVALAAVVLFGSHGAFALDPSLNITQYAHTAWKTRDGVVRGAVGSIAQTPDGYLLVGTDQGLLRFDGMRTTPSPVSTIERLIDNPMPMPLCFVVQNASKIRDPGANPAAVEQHDP